MSAPEPRSPLAELRRPGRHGADGPAPVVIAEVAQGIVQVTARRGRTGDVAARAGVAAGTPLPGPGRSVTAGGLTAIWVQPDSWLVLGPREEGVLARRMAETFGDAASVVDQSHGKTALTLSGTAARAVLAKGCRLDLHPDVFRVGHAGVIQIAEIGCVVHLIDATPTFGLIVPSSLAESFWEWLTISAAEFGYSVA
ncbi:MAG: sarcosine oxidase subunit gamma [Alphaproteobacteria bacterium]